MRVCVYACVCDFFWKTKTEGNRILFCLVPVCLGVEGVLFDDGHGLHVLFLHSFDGRLGGAKKKN